MDEDFIIGDVEESQISNQPKRKSPFIEEPVDDIMASENTSESGNITNKVQRKYSYDVELPDLLPSECELRLDIEQLVAEVDELEPDDQLGYNRIEKRSGIAVSGRLTYQLVVFLRKGLDRFGEAQYDVGCYIRALPPQSALDKEDLSWSYPRVTIMVMLIHGIEPFSSESRVNRDSCTLSSSDPCRGWMTMVTFKSVDDLREQGFLFGSSTIVARGQASFDGCELIDDPDAPVPYAGLENQGATCYLNGLLQSLFHLGRFREIVYTGNDETDEGILKALQAVFYDLETERERSVSSEPLTRAFGWDAMDVGIQHDAQELNRILIDRIENRLKTSDSNEVKDLFCGRIENYIECMDVDFQSRREEDFYDIQLNVVRGYGEEQSVVQSLDESLREYLAVEILEGANAYDAGENRGKQRAKKGVRFTKLPPVLTLQLMRFQFDFETGDMKKINSRFAFDPVIDMSRYCENSGEYTLYSVLVHSGGVDSGHYYSYARCEQDTWYKFDDTSVIKVNEFCAVENNFGGLHLQNCVDYLRTSRRTSSADSSMSGDEKVYSAYMLMYVRTDLLHELLKPRLLTELNPELASQLQAARSARKPDETTGSRRSRRLNFRRKESLDDSCCPVRILDVSKSGFFSNLVCKYSDLRAEWFADLKTDDGQIKLDESGTVATIDDPAEWSVDELLGAVLPKKMHENVILLVISEEPSDVRFFQLTVEDRSGPISHLPARRLGKDLPLVLAVTPEFPVRASEEICVGFIEFNGSSGDLSFQGFRCFARESALSDINQHTSPEGESQLVFAVTSEGLLEPLTQDNLEDGVFLVCQHAGQENAQVYFERKANTVSLDLVLYSPGAIKWSLNQVEASEGVLTGKRPSLPNAQKYIHIPSVDMRDSIAKIQEYIPDFHPDEHELVAYRENPFGPEARAGDNMFHAQYTVANTVNRASFTYHCVVLPKRPPSDPENRQVSYEHICVRYFDDRVNELASAIMVCQPGLVLSDLIRQSKMIFNINLDTPVRLIDIDPHDCEIVSVFREGSAESIPVSALLSWRSRNIFQNSIRIEVDHPQSGRELKCFHFDRSLRSSFGHPFLLRVSSSSQDETLSEPDLRALIAEKLNLALNLTRTWKITEDHGRVMISHAQHPINGQGTPKERALTIKQ